MASPLKKLGMLFLLCCCSWTLANATCGYESCNKEKPGMLNIHLVPHTHNDPGWLITVDQYYYREVQFILDGVVKHLEEDPSKRFTYVEMSFFTRWWHQQDQDVKDRVKALVNQGRLEFTLGGWVMNDEAATHYTAIIDQHALGFQFLRQTFGQCARTKVGWQIDPFGHSREQASLFAQFGFDGTFHGRTDRQDKDNRKLQQTLQFVWHGSPNNLGSAGDIFGGILPHGYDWPKGFHFDVWDLYHKNPHQVFFHDDPTLQDYNVDEMVDGFIERMNLIRTWYGNDHLIATEGSDFNFVASGLNFKLIDQLIKYVNARQANGSNVNLLYSTPSCYLKTLHEDKSTWTTKSDDFFPYANRNHTYWTGYFTSRPAEKFYTRQMSRFLQGVRQLTALAQLDNSAGTLDKVHKLAASVALAQHHDSITGTAKQVVTFDYAQRMSKGQAAGQDSVNQAYDVLMAKGKVQASPVQQVFCNYRNVSVCPTTQKAKRFQVTLYNPLAWPVNYTARVPVDGTDYVVLSDDGKTRVPCDVFPVQPAPSGIRPEEMSAAAGELVFTASLPPLGFVTYFAEQQTSLRFQRKLMKAATKSIKGKYVEVQFDKHGHVSQITNLATGMSAPLQQNFFYYIPYEGNNSRPEFQSSGAYIFRPQNNTPVNLELKKWNGIVKGSAVEEAHQHYSNWLNQVIRVYKDKPYVEFEWTVGPLPKNDGGKEIISRYNIPDWGNNGVFYTDANGREILQRKLNYRPTWQVEIDEPVAGNYYPVDAHIKIKSGDGKRQFTVLVDRAEGGTSLNDGDVELMVHRRLLVDDYFGVSEALNEKGLNGHGLVVRGSHYVLLDTVEHAARQFRPMAKEVFMSAQHSFSQSDLVPSLYVEKYNTQWSGLAGKLPPQVHLLTLERFRGDGPVTSPAGSAPYLVRFEHFYEVKEDADMSESVTFDIKGLFRGLVVVDATELVLGGNAASADIKRLQWKTKDGLDRRGSTSAMPVTLKGTKLTLKPMQIATLQVNFKA